MRNGSRFIFFLHICLIFSASLVEKNYPSIELPFCHYWKSVEHIWVILFLFCWFIYLYILQYHTVLIAAGLSVQSLIRVRLFATPWTTACQASLSITNSRGPPKPMSIEPVMPSNHLILCRPLLLLSPIPPSIRVFSSESALLSRWPKYWEFQLQHQSFQWTPRTGLL